MFHLHTVAHIKEKLRDFIAIQLERGFLILNPAFQKLTKMPCILSEDFQERSLYNENIDRILKGFSYRSRHLPADSLKKFSMNTIKSICFLPRF